MDILWLSRATADLYQVSAHIRQDNPRAAERVGAAIEAATQQLRRYLEMARPGKVAGTRELVVTGTPYLVVYRLRGETVEILRVLHGKQKWPCS
jgi:toxin ParE1/3/4